MQTWSRESATHVPFAVHWCLLLFVFTIPLESADIPGLSLAKELTGLSFFGAYFFYRNSSAKTSLREISKPLWWFTPYIAVYLLHALVFSDASLRQFVIRFMTLIQLMAFCLTTASILRDEMVMRDVVLAYSVACVILAVGTTLSLSGFSSEVRVISGSERITAEGYDANSMAIILSLGILMLIGMSLDGVLKGFVPNVMALMMTLPLAAAIIRTGSRSGLAVLVAGFSIYLLPLWNTRKKVLAWSLAAVGIAGVVWLLSENPHFSRRWEQVYYEGSTAGRDRIYKTGLEMFLERPLLGWGHVESREELGMRLGLIWRQRDPHDLILEIALQVGLVGGLPFFLGLGMFWTAAWNSRKAPTGRLPLAITTAVLFGSLAVPLVTKKFFWLTLAFAIAPRIPSQDALRRISRRLPSLTRTVRI
jgi:O-antigen ligase